METKHKNSSVLCAEVMPCHISSIQFFQLMYQGLALHASVLCLFVLMHLTYLFIHSFGMCRMWWFLAVLRSFFHFSLLCTFSCHPSPPTIHPSSLTSSCHLFLGLPLNLVVTKFIYITLLGILFSSILCTCPNQHNVFNLLVSIIVGF